MDNPKNLYYLGTRVDFKVNSKNFRDIFNEFLKKGHSSIFTINPEFVVDAYFDSGFQKVLNSSDLNIIDGVGLSLGIKKNFKKTLSRKDLNSIKTFPGADVVEDILEMADKNHYSLFILGGDKDKKISEKALNMIKKKYPGINIIGGSSDFSYKLEDDEVTISYIHEKLREKSLSDLDILLVGYGHKRQEFWIKRNASKIPARVSIGVGGTLDFISGNIKRAPKWVRDFGFEWLYRFLKQPSRIFRIIKATLIFSYLSFFVKPEISSKK